MKKRISIIYLTFLLAFILSACGTGKTGAEPDSSENTAVNTEASVDTGTASDSFFHYHFADKDEAVKCYLSNEEYFDGFSNYDLDYRLQKKGATIDEMKAFGASQMEEFTEEEKDLLKKTLDEMENDLKKNRYQLPDIDEITFIKSTQEEESGPTAYTHGVQIYLGAELFDYFKSDEEDADSIIKQILWHELFHCLTRKNPQFRKDMYRMIHFTVQDQDYELPPSVKEIFISNPDVEHHNAKAAFDINGEKIDCYIALIETKPFEKKGESFFDNMETALVPVDGSDRYYAADDASNFWDVFGKNTGYVIDPEECMADNFRFALVYGTDGKEYPNPEIIEQIVDYLK